MEEELEHLFGWHSSFLKFDALVFKLGNIGIRVFALERDMIDDTASFALFARYSVILFANGDPWFVNGVQPYLP